MIKEIKKITRSIEGVETSAMPFAFYKKNGETQVVFNQLKPFFPREGDQLSNCMASSFQNKLLVRSSTIDSHEKAREFLAALNFFSKGEKKKVAVLQLALPEVDWTKVRRQHHLLIELQKEEGQKLQIAHFDLSIENFFIPKSQKSLSADELKPYQEVLHLHNVEALAQYADWLNAEMEEALKTFKPDALDEYRAEATFKDFSHEVHSVLYQHYRSQANACALRLNTMDERAKDFSEEQIFAIEKQLIRAREDIRENLRAQHGVLTRAVEAIKPIEEAHPGLIALKNKFILLKKLMESELQIKDAPDLILSEKILVIQLLNDSLNASSVVNCHTGIHRTNIVFSVMLALRQVSELWGISRTVEMAIHWQETIRTLNHMLARKGVEGYREWRKSPAASLEEAWIKAQAYHVGKLRKCVLANLRAFCVPVIAANEDPDKHLPHQLLRVNRELLHFLPPYIHVLNPGGAKEIIPFLKWDAESGAPQDIAEAAFHLLHSSS